MVLVALHKRFGPIHMGGSPSRVVAKGMVANTVVVALVVGLVHYEDAIAVAKFVEVGIAGIYGHTQQIDVALLHQGNILLVCGRVTVSAGSRMVVVTVDAPQLDILPIRFQHLANNLHFLESDVALEVFAIASERNWIEIWCVWCPEPDSREMPVEAYCQGVARSNVLDVLCEALPINGDTYGNVSCCVPTPIAHLDGSDEIAISPVVAGLSLKVIVCNMHKGAHP